MWWLLLALLLSTPTAPAPIVTPATVFPRSGMSSLWMSLQRVLATYPKEDVQLQLKKLMRVVAEEAYQQHVARNPAAARAIVLPPG